MSIYIIDYILENIIIIIKICKYNFITYCHFGNIWLLTVI